jgi:hypothetical protein
MGIFTIYNNPAVDQKIQSELDVITQEILSSIRPITILLAGSFGRGEGSVLIKDDHIIPVMDYDLLIIAKEDSLLTENELEELKGRIKDRCQSGELERHVITSCHVDLFQSTLEQFQTNAHLSIYDMKSGSILLYGKDVRDLIDIDIGRLSESACYFSLIRSIQSLLEIFSTDYLINPPSDQNRFSMIFFCGKVYLHMGTQLSLCHGLYDTTCRTRVDRITEEFSHTFTDLATAIPDLDDKIRFYSELTLSPDEIFKESLDPVALWFETRQDFETVMKYCLKKFGDMDSDDWVILSDLLYSELRKKYYTYFIEYWLGKRYNIRSRLIVLMVNAIYRSKREPQFAKGKNKKDRVLRWHLTSPLLRLFAISPLLLFSIYNHGSIDKRYFSRFFKEFTSISRCVDPVCTRTDVECWDSKRKVLKNLLK